MSTAESFGLAVGHTMANTSLLDPEIRRYVVVNGSVWNVNFFPYRFTFGVYARMTKVPV